MLLAQISRASTCQIERHRGLRVGRNGKIDPVRADLWALASQAVV
jgi:hypothetical protein